MADWDGLLGRHQRTELRNILIRNGFDTDANFEMLLLDIPPNYRASLPIQGIHNGMMRLDRALRSMNMVVSLKGGQRPLRIFMENALTYVQASDDIAKLEKILSEVEAAGHPAKPTAVETAAEAGTAAAALAPGAALRSALPSARQLNADDIEREALVAGFNETLPIRFLEGGLMASRSVFKIVIHSHADGEPVFGADDTPMLSFGTAWVIAPGLAITNFHVFNARMSFEPPASDLDYRKQVQTARLVVDFHDPVTEPMGFALPDDALAANDSDLDFAIFRLPADLADRPAMPLRRHAVRKLPTQALGTRVNLLQHPGGGIMKLGFRNNFVVVGDNDVLAYLTDTAKGSSGSPVMDDSWKVAALHAGSEDIGDFEINLQGTKVKRRNFGVPIPRILAHLETAHPALHAEITGAIT